MKGSCTKSLIALLLGLALLPALSGCGQGGSEPTVKTEESLTKKVYLRRAHSICYRFSKQQVRETEAFRERWGLDGSDPGQRELERLIKAVVVPVAEEKLAELKKLPAPKGDEREVDALLRAIEKGIRDAEAHPEWLAAPTPAHEQPFEHGMELWLDYGDWLCGQAGG